MTRTNIITLLIIVAVIVAAGFIAFGGGSGSTGTEDSSVSGSLQPGEELPYTDLAGNPVDLSEYEGEVLVINSWASWCPFCVDELPDFDIVAEEFEDEDVTVISINRAESPDTVRAFLEHVGSPEHIVFLLDPDDVFYKSIGGFAMPETVFYEADGEVAVHKRGFMRVEEMRTHIETALDADSNAD